MEALPVQADPPPTDAQIAPPTPGACLQETRWRVDARVVPTAESPRAVRRRIRRRHARGVLAVGAARLALGALAVVALGDRHSVGDRREHGVPQCPKRHSSSGIPSDNFWLADAQGAVWNFGDAGALGSAAGVPLNHPIVTITATKDDQGYWLVASDGGIFSYGDASFYGSTGASRSTSRSSAWRRPPTARATGWWPPTAASSASATPTFYGSTGSIALNKPIVGMAPTPDGKGYWLVASDGGIFNFGDALLRLDGSIHLDQPIVGMARPPRQGLLDGGLRRRHLQLR